MAKKKEMKEQISSVGFNSGVKNPPKNEGRLMALINEYAMLDENDGISPRTLLRKLLLRLLPIEIAKIKSRSGKQN